MRRLLPLVTLAFVVSLVLAPSAVAQYVEEEMKGEPKMEEKMEGPAEEAMEEAMEPVPDPPYVQEKEMQKAQKAKAKAEKAKAKAEKAKAKEMPKTGGFDLHGAAFLGLGTAALLIGGGLLVRRARR